MNQRVNPVIGGLAVDLLEAEAWDECHEAYQAYLQAARIHSRCLHDILEDRTGTGSPGAAEAGARARQLLIEWLGKCEAVSQELAWDQSAGRARDVGARTSV